MDLLGGTGELTRLGTANKSVVLSAAAGGTTLPFTRQKALEKVIQKLGEELHSQYLLSFVPETSTPGFHAIDVRITPQGDFRVRARPGYWLMAGGVVTPDAGAG